MAEKEYQVDLDTKGRFRLSKGESRIVEATLERIAENEENPYDMDKIDYGFTTPDDGSIESVFNSFMEDYARDYEVHTHYLEELSEVKTSLLDLQNFTDVHINAQDTQDILKTLDILTVKQDAIIDFLAVQFSARWDAPTRTLTV